MGQDLIGERLELDLVVLLVVLLKSTNKRQIESDAQVLRGNLQDQTESSSGSESEMKRWTSKHITKLQICTAMTWIWGALPSCERMRMKLYMNMGTNCKQTSSAPLRAHSSRAKWSGENEGGVRETAPPSSCDSPSPQENRYLGFNLQSSLWNTQHHSPLSKPLVWPLRKTAPHQMTLHYLALRRLHYNSAGA